MEIISETRDDFFFYFLLVNRAVIREQGKFYRRFTGRQVKGLAAKQNVMGQQIAFIGKTLAAGMGRESRKEGMHVPGKAGIVLSIAFQKGIALQEVRAAAQQRTVKMQAVQF